MLDQRLEEGRPAQEQEHERQDCGENGFSDTLRVPENRHLQSNLEWPEERDALDGQHVTQEVQ